MRHIPVPAPGRAQDAPHELPGRVPGECAACPAPRRSSLCCRAPRHPPCLCRVSPTVPWRLPSSGPSPSTRYLPGARGSACGEAGSGGGAQWLWSQSFPGLCRLQPNCFMRQALSWPRSAVSRGLLWVRCLGPGSAAALLLFGSQTGVRVLAAMLRHLLTIADAGRFSGPRCRAGCSHPCHISLLGGPLKWGFRPEVSSSCGQSGAPRYSLSAHLPQAASIPLLIRGLWDLTLASTEILPT